MGEIARIENQLKRAFEGPAWSGPSVIEALDGVNAARATGRYVTWWPGSKRGNWISR